MNNALITFKATTSDSADSHKTFREVLDHVSACSSVYGNYLGEFLVRPQDETEIWVEFISTSIEFYHAVKADAFFKCISIANEIEEEKWHHAILNQ